MGYYKGKLIEDNLDIVKEEISNGKPLMEIARDLSVKYDTLKRHLKRLGVEYATNPNRKGRPHYESRVSALYYIENNIPISIPVLRRKLIEEGFKENKCERCGITEWMGGDVPLELHHIDENHHNNRLDNLLILCSNCHAQLHGYNKATKVDAKKHKEKVKTSPKTSTKNKTVRYCKTCGKELKSDQKSFCSKKCLREYSGNRPEYDELKSLLESGFNYCMIAEKYGVTEAAVRKWIKKYDIKR